MKKRKNNVKKPWVDMAKERGAVNQKGGIVKGSRKLRNTIPIIYQYHQ